MSWIQIDSTLADKPQVWKMAGMLKLDRRWVAGGLVALWGWADLHSEDGRTLLTRAEVDSLCGKKGFAEALLAVGWMDEGENGELAIRNFEKYNGASAKLRFSEMRKKQRQRAGKAGLSGDVCPASSGTGGGQERHANGTIEKRREEEKERLSLAREPKEKAAAVPENALDAPAGAGSLENAQNALERADASSAGMDSGRAAKTSPTPLAGSYLRPLAAGEVQKVMQASPNCGLRGCELDDCASRYFDSRQACGWVTARGQAIWDWRADARAYLAAWQQNNRRRTEASASTKKRRDCNDPDDYRF